MKKIHAWLAVALPVILLFSLCLTPAIFAMEGSEPPAANDLTPPQAGDPLPEGGSPPPEEADKAATGEELLDWLEENQDVGGTLTLTGDIFLQDFSHTVSPGAPPITIDTGEFSIIATGFVEVNSNTLTIRGKGGERGLVRAAPGSKLALGYLTLEAQEGFAVVQEEGAGFATTECTITGNIHYAAAPFAWSWKPGLAVVKQGEVAADALPATLAVIVNRNGATGTYEEVGVAWDLAGHADAQENRLRFTTKGKFVEMASLAAPDCTIVYDDYPLTFLLVEGKKLPGGRGGIYQFQGNFSKPEDKLPIIVAQEYSFDKENWLLLEEKDFPSSHTAFNMAIPAKEWDTETYPQIFLRMSWDDDGTLYYSNVLGFAADNLAEGEDHGGNRGGGTDITTPPISPNPDPSEDDDSSDDEDELPNTNPTPEPAPEPTPTPGPPDTSPGDVSGLPAPVPDPSPDPAPEQLPPAVSTEAPPPAPPAANFDPAPSQKPDKIAEIPAETKVPPAPPPETGDLPTPPAPTTPNDQPLPPLPPKNVVPDAPPAPTAAPKGPGALPLAVGGAAVAGCMAAAGLYLHPRAGKHLLEVLGKFLPKK